MKHRLKPQHGGFGLGLIVGLLVGLAAALAVALYVTKTPVPLINKTPQHTPEQDAAEAERNKAWDPNAALAGKPTIRPATPAVPAAPASDTAYVPRTAAPVLPTAADNGRVTALGAAGSASRPAPRSNRDAAAILAGADGGINPKSAATIAAGGDPFIYFVQVGAYSRAEDAEQRRAQLALSGFRATVTEREQSGRTVHRVRLGPFDKKDDADAQQERVKTIDPDAALVRIERAKQ